MCFTLFSTDNVSRESTLYTNESQSSDSEVHKRDLIAQYFGPDI